MRESGSGSVSSAIFTIDEGAPPGFCDDHLVVAHTAQPFAWCGQFLASISFPLSLLCPIPLLFLVSRFLAPPPPPPPQFGKALGLTSPSLACALQAALGMMFATDG